MNNVIKSLLFSLLIAATVSVNGSYENPLHDIPNTIQDRLVCEFTLNTVNGLLTFTVYKNPVDNSFYTTNSADSVRREVSPSSERKYCYSPVSFPQ
jgi:hypothetical protein